MRSVRVFVKLLFVACAFGLGYAHIPLPDYLHVCKRHDPQINQCIINSIEELKPRLLQGIPEYKIPALEPLYIGKITAAEGGGVHVECTDLYIHGAGNYSIKTLEMKQVLPAIVEFEVDFPHLSLDGDYVIDGRVVMVNLKGNGKLHSDIDDANIKVQLTSELIEKGTEHHIHWTDMKVNLSIGKGKIHLTNLLGEDAVIGEMINSAINMNFHHFFKEIKPVIEKTIADFVVTAANDICDGYDMNEIFPE